MLFTTKHLKNHDNHCKTKWEGTELTDNGELICQRIELLIHANFHTMKVQQWYHVYT